MILPSTVPPVEEIAQLIAEAFHPRRIVLFGSRARGTARPDSDIDLMVELETAARPVDRAFAVRRLFGLRYWSMDVVVYTPEEVVRLRAVPGSLMSTIDAEGRILYECAA
ncbi:MAG: nucleotidyltransferase domain-containing protein [Gemmatimonadaceae bacterium]